MLFRAKKGTMQTTTGIVASVFAAAGSVVLWTGGNLLNACNKGPAGVKDPQQGGLSDREMDLHINKSI